MRWSRIIAVFSCILLALLLKYLHSTLLDRHTHSLNRQEMSGSKQAFETWVTQLLASNGYTYHNSSTLQRLWAGYGSIHRVGATDEKTKETVSMICKYVNPPLTSRGSTPDEGHLRKILSYQVEAYFYEYFANQLPPDIAVAKFITSGTEQKDARQSWHLVISDLKPDFPVAGEKRGALTSTQVDAAIDWLASFHGFWWHKDNSQKIKNLSWIEAPLQHWRQQESLTIAKPGLWRNGGYTYLDTRRTEYTSLQTDGGEWSRALCGKRQIAENVARFLSRDSRYHTLIHGDVKSENLFTTRDGSKVAFYDFQYVGWGLGVCDLAKLFTCSVPMNLLGDGKDGMSDGEKTLLQRYLRLLTARSGKEYDWDVLVRHWETALVDWLRFQASWGFWGNTEWLEGRVRSIVQDQGWVDWLERSDKT